MRKLKPFVPKRYNYRRTKPKSFRIPISRNIFPTQSPNALDLWGSMDTEVCVDGPVGCTKTVNSMLYILGLHEKYPKFQSLIVRNEAKTLHTTIIPQLFNKILRYHPTSNRNPFKLYGGVNRAAHILFANEGQMTFGGMDDRGKIMGSEYDLIFYNQVEREYSERNWEALIGRGLEGRAGNWPHPEYGYDRPRFRIIGDANPSAPTHWLKAREGSGILRFISFNHNDNPLYFYDGVETERGIRNYAELEKRYHGYERERMVYGRWVSAEGVVYTMFKPKQEDGTPHHIRYVHRHEIGDGWRWFLGIDYGTVNAMCVQLWALSPKRDRHIMYKEIYGTDMTPQTFIPMIGNMLDSVGITKTQLTNIFSDHNASHNKDLRNAGYFVTEADKVDKLSRIDLCKDWLAKEYEVPGKPYPEPAVVFNSNSLFNRPDPTLKGQPKQTVDEFPLYSYKEEENRKGDYTDEAPMKKWDHGMDPFGYYMRGVMEYVPYHLISAHANFAKAA